MTITCNVPISYNLVSMMDTLAVDRSIEDVISQALIFAYDNREFWADKTLIEARVSDASTR